MSLYLYSKETYCERVENTYMYYFLPIRLDKMCDLFLKHIKPLGFMLISYNSNET